MKNKLSTLPIYRGLVFGVLFIGEAVIYYDPPFSDFQTWAIAQVFLVMWIIVSLAAFLVGFVVWLHDRPKKLRHVFDDANILD